MIDLENSIAKSKLTYEQSQETTQSKIADLERIVCEKDIALCELHRMNEVQLQEREKEIQKLREALDEVRKYY